MKKKDIKKKKIGVLMGGVSEEREISLKTGNAVLKALLSLGYKAVAIDADSDVAGALRRKSIEVAFIALHGRYGEDGCIQGVLEVMGIPYTGSGVQSSSIAMDKAATKKMFAYHGISTPAWKVLKPGEEAVTFKPPIIVKPSSQGSAIGVSLVLDKAGIKPALKEAKRHGRAVLVEKYIKGKELTVSILNGRALPVIEIRPKKGLYDYDAKYTKGATDFIVPAAVTKTAEKKVSKEALGAYEALRCRGAARVDVILDKNTPYVLEVNTVPGLTELSLFPRAAAKAGLTYPGLVEQMLLGAGLDEA